MERGITLPGLQDFIFVLEPGLFVLSLAAQALVKEVEVHRLSEELLSRPHSLFQEIVIGASRRVISRFTS